MSCKSLNERTLSKIKRELKAAIFFSREEATILQNRMPRLVRSARLGSAQLSS